MPNRKQIEQEGRQIVREREERDRIFRKDTLELVGFERERELATRVAPDATDGVYVVRWVGPWLAEEPEDPWQ